MSDITGLTGEEIAGGVVGTASFIGLIWWFIRTAADRERARAATAAAALNDKDATIKEFGQEAFSLLRGDVHTLKEDYKDVEKRLSQIEGKVK